MIFELKMMNFSAVASTPKAELVLNGASLGVKATPPQLQTSTDSRSVTWILNGSAVAAAAKPGASLTLNGFDSGGATVVSHTIRKPGAPAAVRFVVDIVPSAATGTGSKLVLDGRDTALLRAEIVDAEGVVCTTSGARLDFRVISGAGKIKGTSNGDSTSHELMGSPSIAAFGGLARVLVQVSADCTAGAKASAAIDLDGVVTTTIPSDSSCAALAAGGIVVGVSLAANQESGALLAASASVTVEVGGQAEHSAMAVARVGAMTPLDFTYLADFQG